MFGHILPFSAWVQTIPIKMRFWIYVVLQSSTSILFLDNLPPHGTISKTATKWYFSVADKANSSVSFAGFI